MFQPAPVTEEEIERAKPLELSPTEVLEFSEKEWYEKAYRGPDAPQLTVRAVLMGTGLGFFLAFTNIYIGLKTGWFLGVALTACILSYSIWSSLHKSGLVKSQMTILENNCMQSTASAAGYAVGNMLISAVPALMLLSVNAENPKGTRPPLMIIGAWIFLMGIIGTVLAIPLKRNMINREKLRFPSGTAAAVTLQSFYSEGKEAILKARALVWSAAVAALVPLIKDLDILKIGKTTGAGWQGFINPIRAFVGANGNPVTHEGARDALIPGGANIFDWIPNVLGLKLGYGWVGGKLKAWKLSDYTIKLDLSIVLVAAGSIIGLRATWSMILGAILFWSVLAPHGLAAGAWKGADGFIAGLTPPSGPAEFVTAVTKPGAAIKEIGIWFGAPLMVAAALVTLAFQWRTFARAFSGLLGKKVDADATYDALVDATEVPTKWFGLGMIVPGILVILMGWLYFEIPPVYGLLALAMTLVMGLVACRATGETDITPGGALGKLMQLTYGILIPQSTTANIMTASITTGSSLASADLLNDLKSGYLLGANPRRQFLAQLLGVGTGTIASCLCFFILVPDVSVFQGDEPKFPVPSAQQWMAVAVLFRDGLSNFHPFAKKLIGFGLMTGVLLASLEFAFSSPSLKKFKKYIPSATGVGLGMVLPFFYPLAMFIGAILAEIALRINKVQAERYTVAIASGAIAGESIMGVVVAALNNFVL